LIVTSDKDGHTPADSFQLLLLACGHPCAHLDRPSHSCSTFDASCLPPRRQYQPKSTKKAFRPHLSLDLPSRRMLRRSSRSNIHRSPKRPYITLWNHKLSRAKGPGTGPPIEMSRIAQVCGSMKRVEGNTQDHLLKWPLLDDHLIN
jgi:hypothetical protein